MDSGKTGTYIFVVNDYELKKDNMLVVDHYLRITNTIRISTKFNMIKPQNRNTGFLSSSLRYCLNKITSTMYFNIEYLWLVSWK
jgi:hypothetical protein